MALNPSGAISLGGPVAGQSIALELGLSPTAVITLNDTAVRTLAGVPSGTIIMPTNFWGKSAYAPTQKAIFAFGATTPASPLAVSNLVSNTGVMAADTPRAGRAATNQAGATYGGDKAIFGLLTGISNLVSNTGVMAADTGTVATSRSETAASAYGGDKAIFAFGRGPQTPVTAAILNTSNLVSNTGVVASDTPGVGTARRNIAAATYGEKRDKAIFGFGLSPIPASVNITNLVSNTGVVASDTPGVGQLRNALQAAGYGGDKAIFAFGTPPGLQYSSVSNLVSNTGVVASDVTNAVQVRHSGAASGYGGDKAIFGFGDTPLPLNAGRISITNLISNTGIMASTTPGAPGVSNREGNAAAGYSST